MLSSTQASSIYDDDISVAPSSHVHVGNELGSHVHAVSQRYESLNYEKIENTLTEKEAKKPRHQVTLWRQSVNRWLVCFLSGVGTACVGAVINIVIDFIIQWKFGVLQKYMNSCSKSDCMYTPLLLWILINCGFTMIAASLVLFLSGPVAAGSGIPQIKCFLNGIKIPGVVSLKTLFAKATGVLFSVSGGLCVGKEGPMIHSGACVAARISQGKTADGHRRAIDCHVFEYYRNDAELRDFVACGSAAGVAAAFGAPIGGTLFSLEEGASFWNQSLTWRMFFTSMVCAFFLNVIMGAYNGVPGALDWSGLFNFGVFTNSTYTFWDFICYLIYGVIGGLSGAFFNYLNYKLTLFRIGFCNKPWQKMMEALVVASATACVSFVTIVFVHDCKPYQSDVITTVPVQMYCPDGQYSGTAALFMQSPENAVVSLYHEDAGAYGFSTLAIYCVLMFFLALWTYGLAVPSGLFIPSLLVGATWGRLISIGLQTLFPGGQVGQNTGLYALAGSAAQLAGNVRMTISLCVILLEATGDLVFGLPLMIVLLIAKWVGDLFGEGLYDIHIELAEVPILGFDPPPLAITIPAKKVMARPVTVFREVEQVGIIYDTLMTETHNNYPVVDEFIPTSPDSDDEDTAQPSTSRKVFGRLKGVMMRDQLIVLLENKSFSVDRDGLTIVGRTDLRLEEFREKYPKYERVLENLELSPGDRECFMDLRPFMNRAPYTVSIETSLYKMYQLFRGLGLRHIIVTDADNYVVGIVTRKDIARYRSETHKGRYKLKELFISEQPPMNMGSN